MSSSSASAPTLAPSTFRAMGNKRALLIGVNYSGSAKLHGCIRDVTFLHHLLRTKFGFKDRDFYVLTDKSCGIRNVYTARPTRKNMLNAMHWLVANAQPGDSLFFSFSGHGSQCRDTSGDEADGYDETILPMDYKTAGHIVDDEIYNIMVRRMPAGARLTALMDCCHSGTGMDLPYIHDVYSKPGGVLGGGGGGSSLPGAILSIAGNLLAGDKIGALQQGMKLMGNAKRRRDTRAHTPDPNAGEVLLFSGCRDNQVSSDTNALAGVTTGAMTYCFVHAMEHGSVSDWRRYTYRSLLQSMRHKLRAGGFSQVPQFSTSHPFELNSPFVI